MIQWTAAESKNWNQQLKFNTWDVNKRFETNAA